jgi:hypothetical protein
MGVKNPLAYFHCTDNGKFTGCNSESNALEKFHAKYIEQQIKDNDDSESESNNEPPYISYFRHPTKGMFKVNSRVTALEVFGILNSQNDSRAAMWLDLADRYQADGY